MKIVGVFVHVLVVLSTCAFAEDMRNDVKERQFPLDCSASGLDTQISRGDQNYRYVYTTSGCPPWDATNNQDQQAERDVKTYYVPKYPVFGDKNVWVGEYNGRGYEMGPIGITIYGTALFANIAMGGGGAVGNEPLDECLGHPQEHGIYHQHSQSPCMDTRVGKDPQTHHSLRQGYAFDGFGIYGGDDIGPGALDTCRGHTHALPDGSTNYHYHMTSVEPYSLVCLRGCVATGNSFTSQNCQCQVANDCPTKTCLQASCTDNVCRFTASHNGYNCLGGSCSDGECVTAAAADDNPFAAATGSWGPPVTADNPFAAATGSWGPPVAADNTLAGTASFGKPTFPRSFHWSIAGVGLGAAVTLVAVAVMNRRRRYEEIESVASV